MYFGKKMSSEKTRAKLRALKDVFSEYIAYTMLYSASLILLFVLSLLLGDNMEEDAFGIKVLLFISYISLAICAFESFRLKSRAYCSMCDNDGVWRD